MREQKARYLDGYGLVALWWSRNDGPLGDVVRHRDLTPPNS
jgi:hypothetical protein